MLNAWSPYLRPRFRYPRHQLQFTRRVAGRNRLSAYQRDKYPVTKDLHEAYIGKASQRTPNVVSEALCDDILKYIGPSLEKHKGCTIIDIHPGACIWSSKLHDVLKPKAHILMEPDLKSFRKFIQPLLDKQDSKYQQVSYPTEWFNSYEKVMDEIVAPNVLEKDQKADLNNSLLVTGNLTTWGDVGGVGATSGSSLARQLISRFNMSLLDSQLFHKFGRAKMLLWVDEDEKWAFLPRTLPQKSRLSMTTQYLVNTTEIAGRGEARRSARGKGRSPTIDLESHINVAARMESHGIEIPPNRRDRMHAAVLSAVREEEVPSPIKASMESTMDLRTRRDPFTKSEIMTWLASVTEKDLRNISGESYKQIRDAQTRMAEGTLPFPPDELFRNSLRLKTEEFPEWAMMVNLMSRSRHNNIRHEKRRAVLAQCSEVLRLERVLASNPLEETRDQATKQYAQAQSSLTSMRAKLTAQDKKLYDSESSEYLGLLAMPCNLMWDQREFEPILIHPEEMFPVTQSALLQFEPKAGPLCSAEEFAGFQDIMVPLFLARKSLKAALESASPGAGELIDAVPSLKNPFTGGRSNIQDTMVRELTIDMVMELARAWKDWPYRPPGSDRANYFESMMMKFKEF